MIGHAIHLAVALPHIVKTWMRMSRAGVGLLPRIGMVLKEIIFHPFETIHEALKFVWTGVRWLARTSGSILKLLGRIAWGTFKGALAGFLIFVLLSWIFPQGFWWGLARFATCTFCFGFAGLAWTIYMLVEQRVEKIKNEKQKTEP